MSEKKYYFFNEKDCDLCGLCLNKCPVLALSIEEAKNEMQRLIKGEKPKHVFSKCTSCMTCNLICPKNCNPYELIIFRWYEKYKEKGLSKNAKFMLTPLQSTATVWSLLKERFPEDEKKTIQSWSKLSKCDELLYPGCTMCCSTPYLYLSTLFTGFNIMMTDELCCGEPFYRIGVLDTAEEVAKRLEQQYNLLNVKKVIFPCLGCFNTIKNIYPTRFKVKYDFEATGLLDILWKRIENGEIKIISKVNKKLTVHDNCHAKPFGTRYFDLSRKILQKCGVELVEMKHNKENALCCGIASFARKQDVMDIINDAQVRLKEAEETHAAGLVVYCQGCLMILSLAKFVLKSNMPIYYWTEILQEAIGEKPLYRLEDRTKNAMEIIMEDAPKYLAELPKRYWM
jgi:Fe-S oxidoreductase